MQTSRLFCTVSCAWIVFLAALPLLAKSTPAAHPGHKLRYITIKTGGPHPRTERMTVERWKKISREAEATTLREIHAGNARRKQQRLHGQ